MSHLVCRILVCIDCLLMFGLALFFAASVGLAAPLRLLLAALFQRDDSATPEEHSGSPGSTG